jgi:hypothetical protein
MRQLLSKNKDKGNTWKLLKIEELNNKITSKISILTEELECVKSLNNFSKEKLEDFVLKSSEGIIYLGFLIDILKDEINRKNKFKLEE